jgi:Protein of unknown function (DUF3631)/Toprim domain
VSAREPYIPSGLLRDAVRGREPEVLRALGIQLSDNSRHIRCPYPDHPDHEPSWRWDEKRKVAFCSCIGTRPNEKKGHNIFAVVGTKEGVDFETAKMRVTEIIGRHDLIITEANGLNQRTDAGALLNPASENQDDALAWTYLGHRLGIEPQRVPRPATKVVGLKSLPYFDPPQRSGGKPIHVGDYPAAVFETMDRDGKRHAHRIYLEPGGAGKAELGVGPKGQPREPKKSAKKTANESTAGRAVIWGDSSTAETNMLFEGIETAAAAAFAFESEILSGKTMVAACITAGGIEAFKPWPAAKHVVIGADRDEGANGGSPPTRRGEIAARKFAELHHRELDVSIALPGNPGEKTDWLDVLRRDGIEAVVNGIVVAEPYAPPVGPTNNGKDENQRTPSDDAEIARLARLPPLAYDREREPAARLLGCRVGTLDEQVRAARGETASTPGQGRPINLTDPEPWPVAVDGAVLLDALSSTIRDYVIVSDVQADAVALWSAHTHAHDASDVSPKLVVKSVQKRSGKSRMAEVLERIVARPLFTSGIKPAALLRIIEMQAPTLLLDEMDTAMKQDHEMAEALRGIINSGFNRSGARFIMNVPTPGGGFEPRQFSTWAPQFLCGIGDLPDTVRDRSIEIEMMRKRSDEKVKRLRRKDGNDLQVLCRKSARWAGDNLENLRDATPEIPYGFSDRAADAWEPLFAIADLAGGDWPQRARKAALALSGEHVVEDDNIGTMLLSDIRAIFGMDPQVYVTKDEEKQIPSEWLVVALVAIEGRPWAEFGRMRKPLTPNSLARLLKSYKIRPGTIRIGPGEKDTAKGYKLAQFADVFARYLPAPYPQNQTVTPSQANESVAFCASSTVTPLFDVTVENARNASVFAGCDGVTDGEPFPRDDEAGAEEGMWTV